MAWGFQWLETLLQDSRFGLRQFGRSPAFTAVVVISLAFGIGANTAIFSLIDTVMLRTLPVKNPEQLVFLNQKGDASEDVRAVESDIGSDNVAPFSFPSFEEIQAHNEVLSSLIGFVSLGKPTVSVDGRADLAEGELVTGNYFSGLGVSPILGRAITNEDVKPAAPRVAVISDGYWSRQLGNSPQAVGKGIVINGEPFTIVGVAPPEFFGVQPGRAVDVWVPMLKDSKLLPHGFSSGPGGRDPFTSRDWWWLMLMGRLKPGVTERQAATELEVLFQQSIQAKLKTPLNPESTPHIQLEPASRGLAILRQEFSKPLSILMIIVALVLLISCANVATLLVARSTARQKEMVMRRALGASRGRLLRQLLSESVLLAAIGGALGLLLAFWGSHALVFLMSSGGEPIPLDVKPDAKVLGFTALVSVLTGILFGLAPAFRSTQRDLTPALKVGLSGASDVGQRTRLTLGKPLVVAQIAMSLLLLIGAGLFVRTLGNLENQNLGFNQNHLLLFGVDPTQDGYRGERLMEFYGQLLTRLQALPGVKSATASEITLLSGTQNHWGISIQGYEPLPEKDRGVDWNFVGPSFFETMGIPLLVGRGVDWRDTARSPKVAVVNESLARRFLGGRNPVGYTITFENFLTKGEDLSYEIVGMVRDAKYASLRREPRPTVYGPFNQEPFGLGALHFELRTVGDPLTILPTVRRTVRDLNPNLALSDVKTQTQQIAETLVQERLFARLSGFFSGLAVLLACIGLYGLMAFAVTRRTGEIGIRMALGARRQDILRMIMLETSAMVALGIALGVPAALGATRFIRSMLYGLKPTDPMTFVASALLITLVVALAGYLPARRATKVDPTTALRWE